MQQSFKLSLCEPCSQSWEDLSPAAGGRFCDSCQLTVVDFSALTNQELLAYFHHHSGRISGYVHPSQTNGMMRVYPSPKRTFRLPRLVATLVCLINFPTQAQSEYPFRTSPVVERSALPPKPMPIDHPIIPVPYLNTSEVQGRLGGVHFQPVDVKLSWQEYLYNRIEDLLRFF